MSLSTVNLAKTNTMPMDLTWVQKAAVLTFGAVILFVVGFSAIPEAHNAAHDTRHSLAFPCH